MNTAANQEVAVLERFASHSESLRQALLAMRNEWEPKSPPPYVVMAEYAERLTRDGLEAGPVLAALLRDTEQYIESGGDAADLVAVGFLEALLGRASGGRFDFSKIVHLLGTKSLEYCKAWDQHTGCTTTAEAQLPPTPDSPPSTPRG
jgi:hypothetical protein